MTDDSHWSVIQLWESEGFVARSRKTEGVEKTYQVQVYFILAWFAGDQDPSHHQRCLTPAAFATAMQASSMHCCWDDGWSCGHRGKEPSSSSACVEKKMHSAVKYYILISCLRIPGNVVQLQRWVESKLFWMWAISQPMGRSLPRCCNLNLFHLSVH